ncbi:methyl-accepting chemotaxis protein [Azospirillum rugosum]|uniref:Methyl-accepting chemotaxis protein n=1 Tax=Azospirillum rugosum TaxID=416170 RepID=A0ABS4SSB7_9PROT|nr:methyl-accepting chemotaxis protein [Azospirillum rugosum]MBP2295458.1 methyl-accepting chemotaxis protein [Azospirillum rugosum]MDQ0528337.1 methyl-accepting chemotaxis protein [Azospirillum rugosum]
MNSISIKAKLAAVFAAMFLLVIGLGVFAGSRLAIVNDVARDLGTNWLVGMRYASAVSIDFGKFRIAESRHILSTDEVGKTKVEKDLEERLSVIRADQAKYEPTITPGAETAVYQEVKAALAEYLAIHKELLALSRQNDGQKAAALFMGRSREAYQKVMDGLDRIITINTNGGDAAVKAGEDTYDHAKVMTGLIVALVGLLAAGAWLLMQLSVSKPVQTMTGAMTRLADGDVGVEVPALDHKDEIGAMARAVQVFKQNLIRNRRMEQEAKEADERARAEKRQAMLDLARRFEDRVGGIVNSVGSAATELQATATQLSAAVEEVSNQCVAVAAASEQASANVQTVAAASEEMSSSIQGLSERVSLAASRSKAAADGAGLAQRELDALSTAIEQVDQIVASINAVASQTNLLALNATIEAARAGEAGKGFAVVASEVKNLANQTHTMTDQIASNLSAVKSASSRTVDAMRTIIGQVADIDRSTAEMAASVEQQSAATGEISRNAQQAATGTVEVSHNVSGIQRAEADTSGATSNVKTASDELARQAALLKSEVDAFLGEIRAA